MNIRDFCLLVGLGNPGGKYLGTRHNIGFMVLEKLAEEKSINFHINKKFHGLLAEFKVDGKTLRFLMPTTYMNESGKSIRAALKWFNLKEDQLLILVDDMDLPLGKIRFRAQGSSGGHNGLKSTIEHLKTNEFSRVRIGIGPPSFNHEERKAKTVSHVLGKFTSRELPIVNEVISEIINSLDNIYALDIEKTMNRLNSFESKII